MNKHTFATLPLLCALLIAAPFRAQPQPAPAPPATNAPRAEAVLRADARMDGGNGLDLAASGALPNFASFLGLTSLVINPKVITRTDGEDTTVGVEYKYERHLKTVYHLSRTDVDFFVHSHGLIVADEEDTPNRLLTHGVRLSLTDLWSSKRLETPAGDAQRQFFRNVNDNYVQDWEELAQDYKKAKNANERDGIRAQMNHFFGHAQAELEPYGVLQENLQTGKLYLTARGQTKPAEWRESVMQQMKLIVPRPVFLSFDLNGDAETDQTFSDVQLVGQAQLRGKILADWFDYPFALIRGTEKPVHRLNRNGGPHFWGGVGIVDASSANTRTELVGKEDNFARAHFGIFYRTEVYSGTTPKKSVSLELTWRYYYEFDAPAAIRRADLDHTSYFKATLLFWDDYFLEYTDGKLPLDVEGASTVSVGWRHNF